MSTTLTRRGFLATGAAFGASAMLPSFATAAPERAPSLTATTRTLDINGRGATVFGIENQNGQQGLILDPGQRFSLELENRIMEETIIHWHGQIPPNEQDGVPDMPMPKLKPGERRAYDYASRAGTHWMHAHVPLQEMQLLAAPLIVRSKEEIAADRQQVVMILQDFSFTPPEELIEKLTSGEGGHHGMKMAPADSGGHDMSNMKGMSGMSGMGGMAMEMDLNDIEFDAYLANSRTLADPEIVQAAPGGRILLRVINASSATVYWIDSGALDAELVAVDGHPVKPLSGKRFGIAMGQRLDIHVTLPGEGGAFPILALREGTRERSGLVLVTPGAEVKRIAEQSETEAPAFGIAQEMRLQTTQPLPQRPADAMRMVMLGGNMSPYEWTINGKLWGDHEPITARSGERIELMMHNMSMMGHPMHLHGHVFQVVAINGKRFNGALRDTVYVPPMAEVTVAIDAGEAARWMFHCHHMPHLATGMMTEFAVSA